MNASKITLLKHDGVQFDDQIVYLTGHAYIDCQFNQCTIILRDGYVHLEKCVFSSCVWHIDYIVHDESQADVLLKLLTEHVKTGLPKSP